MSGGRRNWTWGGLAGREEEGCPFEEEEPGECSSGSGPECGHVDGKELGSMSSWERGVNP